jgi:uncharacterized protein YoxC
MKCPRCSTENDDGNTYCRSCGQTIDPKVAALEASLTVRLEERVKAAIEAKYKDAKLLEVEVAEGVAKRLVEWSKTLGIFIAIPIAILALVLGLFGIKSYTEFTAKIDETKKSAETSVETQLAAFKVASQQEFDKATTAFKEGIEKQKQDLDKLVAAGKDLGDRYAQLNFKLSEYEHISQRAADVETKLNRIADAQAQQDKIIGKLNSQVQTLIGHIGKTDILGIGSGIAYESGMQIDADGSPHAYHPDNKSGLAPLSDAGGPGDWVAVITGSGGNPIIQTADDPAPGFYVSWTALQDPSRDRKDPRRYVNSETVNYITIPSGFLRDTGNPGSAQVKLGDIAVVIRPETGGQAYAIVADRGSPHRIGEGSIALAKALGIPSSARTGAVAEGIVYVVFPGSGQGRPLSQQEIDQKGASLFSKWGGMEMAKSSFQKLAWPSAKASGK